MKRFVLHLVLSWLVLISTTLPLTAACRRNRAVFGCAPAARFVRYAQRAVVVRKAVVAQAVVAVPVAVSADYYFSVTNYYRDQLLADAIAYRVLVGLGQTQGQGQAPAKGQEMPGAEEDDPPIPPVQGKASAVDPKLAAVVQKNCLTCHTGNSPKGGGFDLSDLSRVSQLHKERAFRYVDTGRMPKGGDPLKDDEAKLFNDWADGVAPAPARKTK